MIDVVDLQPAKLRFFCFCFRSFAVSTTRGYSHYGLTGGSGLFEGPAKDYQMAQFIEITLPLGVILVVTTL